VLIVEDDEAIARLLRDNLVYERYDVERASTAPDAQAKLKRFKPDLVLLDLMLPEGHGFDVCRALGGQRERPGIIILSARTGKDDKVRGLDLGADDYVTKPFAFEELLARMKAVMRRRDSTVSELRLGQVIVDFQGRRATLGGRDLGLSHREFAVLHYLADRRGRVVTRDDLLQEVWGYHYLPLTRSVDISIARLRRKIEPDPHRPRYIRTLHGEGYSLTPED
jgi:two-component system response regulator VicR